MAIDNGYCTLAELKGRLDITDTDNDTELESVIEAVSRWIDQWMRYRRGTTQFFAISESRYFTAFDPDRIAVHDLTSLTSLKTDEDGDGTHETTWDTGDYWLWPYSAQDVGERGEPYEHIEITFDGDEAFPVNVPRGVEVTGSWGYNSGASDNCPSVIREACILASMRLWKRRDAIFGVSGPPALGQQTIIARIENDADIIALLSAIPARSF